MSKNPSPQSVRLKRFIDETGYSVFEFGKQCGIPSSKTMSDIIVKGKVPSPKVLDKIVNRFPQLNHDWVVLGYGEMIVKGIQNQPATPNSLQKSQAATYENIEQYLQNHDFAINELANMIKKALIANNETINTFHNKIANYENTIATEIDKAYKIFDEKVIEVKDEIGKELTAVVQEHKKLIDSLDQKRTDKLEQIQSEVRQNWVRYEAKIDKDLAVFGKKLYDEFNAIRRDSLAARAKRFELTNELDDKRLKFLTDKFEEVKADFKKNSDANTKKAMDFVLTLKNNTDKEVTQKILGSFKKHSNPKPQK